VVVIAPRCVDWLLLAVVLALLAAWVVTLDAVSLVVETTAAATGALVVEMTAAVLVVVAAVVPKAAHPPIVPTIAAVATADLRPATSCWRREVSVRAIVLSPFRSLSGASR
jgi:hypothetical protein